MSHGAHINEEIHCGYDVRAVANFVLDQADHNHQTVSNLSLNKIIYFLHCAFLHRFRRPLVSAKIEAWDHGPVFREVYHQFKRYGRDPIKGRAHRIDIASGAYAIVNDEFLENEADFLSSHAAELLRISPGKLVDMSHIKDGPWYKARYLNGIPNPGVEITNELILSDVESRH